MNRLILKIVFVAIAGIVISAPGDTLSISGKVVDVASKPIAGAIVSIQSQAVCDTTDAAGAFSLSKTGNLTGTLARSGRNSLQTPIISRGMVHYALNANVSEVSFSLFSLNGSKVFAMDLGRQLRGSYAVDLGCHMSRSHVASGTYLLSCQIGSSSFSWRVMLLASLSGRFLAQPTGGHFDPSLRQMAAIAAVIADTVLITRDGYYDKKVPLQSYVADLGTITLDKIGSGTNYLAGAIVAYPFPLASIRLNAGTRLDSMRQLNASYLLSIDNDRLLYYFRQTAGLSAPGSALGGWENQDVKGHFMGHLLSACAKGYATSGDTLLRNKGNLLVTELGKCQDKIGTGYLFASSTSLFDKLEAGQSVWAPYYTAHKIMAGLLDMYNLCGNTQALDMCKKMATYFKGRMDKLSADKVNQILETRYSVAGSLCYSFEFGGMGEVMHDLYKVTHDSNHIAFAHVFDRPWFRDMLSGNNDLLGYYALHANTHIPMVLSLGSRYEITGESVCRNAVLNFCNMMKDHTWAHGGCSGMPPDHNRTNCENYSYPNQWYDQMAAADQAENCCAHNLNEVAEKAFSYTADPRYADEYEKRLINVAMSQQGAGNGQYTYFLRTKQGAVKSFGDALNTFWCCYGTGVEAYETFADGAYFYDKQRTIWVNQFVSSTLSWAEKGLTMKQITNFPEEQGSRFELTLTSPQSLSIRIRIPAWATSGVSITVNGAAQSGVFAPSSYITIDRTWANGDVVQIGFPFKLSVERMPDRPEYVAVKYGPQMLGAITSANATFSGDETMFANSLLAVSGKPCNFTATLSSGTVTFKPLNRIVGETYNAFTILKSPVAAMVVDSVIVANTASESTHAFQSASSTTGTSNGKTYRAASSGGSFSYTMAVDPAKKMQLQCSYWGSDATNRTFYILVDGQYLTTQVLQNNFPSTFFVMNYPIPDRFIAGKQKVVITFQPKSGNTAGGVFDFVKTIYCQ